MSRTALLTGSFDPVTLGHLDVVRQGLTLADRVVVAIGTHPGKIPMFPVDERRAMLEEACAALSPAPGAIAVATFAGLAVEAAKEHGATMILRGLRDGTDFDYESTMAAMNAAMAPDIVTVFVAAAPALRPITATLVRQIAAMGGSVEPFVPPAVLRRVQARFTP